MWHLYSQDTCSSVHVFLIEFMQCCGRPAFNKTIFGSQGHNGEPGPVLKITLHKPVLPFCHLLCSCADKGEILMPCAAPFIPRQVSVRECTGSRSRTRSENEEFNMYLLEQKLLGLDLSQSISQHVPI